MVQYSLERDAVVDHTMRLPRERNSYCVTVYDNSPTTSVVNDLKSTIASPCNNNVDELYHITNVDKWSSNRVTDFFEKDLDLVDFVFSYLDVQSLLSMCCTTTKTSSILRYEHVVRATTAPNDKNSNSLPTRTKKNKSDYYAEAIVTKVATVFGIRIERNETNHHETTTTRTHSTSTSKSTRCSWLPTPPTPMRLLRLANGRKCERCMCRLVPYTEMATSTGTTARIVLPSLSLGLFCCTQCIFQPAATAAAKKGKETSCRLRC